jgi:hypothetical protein
MENSKFKNKGKLWINQRKEKDTQPDWKGKANYEGVDFEIALWYNPAPEGETGEGTFSAILSAPYVKQETENKPTTQWQK